MVQAGEGAAWWLRGEHARQESLERSALVLTERDVRHDEEQDRRQRHAREHGSTPSERCRQLEGETLPAAGAIDVQEVRATRDGLERGHLRGSLGQLELVEHHLALGQQPAGAPECGTCEVWSSS
jgi:hypothetical protein|tara:strand:- start:416 stop:790 length:375 start_codon:yes stop_codon:yes gene_type:complete